MRVVVTRPYQYHRDSSLLENPQASQNSCVKGNSVSLQSRYHTYGSYRGVNPGGMGEVHPPNNLSYAAIFDDLSCGFNGLPFLANMVTDCYSLFYSRTQINKVQTSIVRIAEKKIKLCFLYAAEQRCSKKKETSVADNKKKERAGFLLSC